MNYYGLTIILSLGFVIILNYWTFIFKGKFNILKWWFGLDKVNNFLSIFIITSLLAAIGFIYTTWYYTDKLDNLPQKQKNKILTEIIISLTASIIWTPAVYFSMIYKKNIYIKNILKTLAAVSLGITAGAAGAATYYIGEYAPMDEFKIIGIIALSLYVFHTGIIDFGLWNYYYLKNH